MIKESDIVHENGKFWVLRNRKESAYYVMAAGVTASQSDSAYPLNDDGLSLAIARCNYLEQRAGAKSC